MNAYFAAMFLTFVGLVIVLGFTAYALEVDANQKLTDLSRHFERTEPLSPVDELPDLPQRQTRMGHDWPARAVAITAAVLVLAIAAPANAATPHRGEGWISLVGRVCGSSSGWEQIARANGSSAPRWILPLRNVSVRCPGKASTGAAKPSTKPTAKGWQMPLTHYRVSDCYGYPKWRGGAKHRGIDLAAPTGTPIHAIGAGTVVGVGWLWSGYGREVIIRHSSGVFSHYAHQSRTGVRVGQTVSKGQTIGWVGASGAVTGPHLHLEIMSSANWGHQVNPTPWLRARGVKVGGC
jgi:murein DD-endopeptidase MepM/ murein hydrolase activator NlpD